MSAAAAAAAAAALLGESILKAAGWTAGWSVDAYHRLFHSTQR